MVTFSMVGMLLTTTFVMWVNISHLVALQRYSNNHHTPDIYTEPVYMSVYVMCMPVLAFTSVVLTKLWITSGGWEYLLYGVLNVLVLYVSHIVNTNPVSVTRGKLAAMFMTLLAVINLIYLV